ncbi:hypothetical protein GXM_05351 [Nostoc sphaeroides CCNUC1]|uniref:Uncharacterized protein n=1 Tax=Nostoc sphaeroides CCNUC1 TaxID=2653204 RepID=A0A5P8W7E8_9NOSO|nr:hypothetical protein GXM_05351 [Nostoc sphaeroides CCNUC1]
MKKPYPNLIVVYLGTITKLLLIYISKCFGINKNNYQNCEW